MNKWCLLVLATVWLIIFYFWVWPNLWIGKTRTPELLGDAGAVLIKLPDQVIGFTWNEYALFLIHGRGETRVQCQLDQVAGVSIGDYPEGGLNCLMVWRSESKFSGWIDFRGHERKFCGAEIGLDFPEACLWH